MQLSVDNDYPPSSHVPWMDTIRHFLIKQTGKQISSVAQTRNMKFE